MESIVTVSDPHFAFFTDLCIKTSLVTFVLVENETLWREKQNNFTISCIEHVSWRAEGLGLVLPKSQATWVTFLCGFLLSSVTNPVYIPKYQ